MSSLSLMTPARKALLAYGAIGIGISLYNTPRIWRDASVGLRDDVMHYTEALLYTGNNMVALAALWPVYAVATVLVARKRRQNKEDDEN